MVRHRKGSKSKTNTNTSAAAATTTTTTTKPTKNNSTKSSNNNSNRKRKRGGRSRGKRGKGSNDNSNNSNNSNNSKNNNSNKGRQRGKRKSKNKKTKSRNRGGGGKAASPPNPNGAFELDTETYYNNSESNTYNMHDTFDPYDEYDEYEPENGGERRNKAQKTLDGRSPFVPANAYGDPLAESRWAAKASLISRDSRPPSPKPPSPPAMPHASMLAINSENDGVASPNSPRGPADPSGGRMSLGENTIGGGVWIFPRSGSLSRIAPWTVEPAEEGGVSNHSAGHPSGGSFIVSESGTMFEPGSQQKLDTLSIDDESIGQRSPSESFLDMSNLSASSIAGVGSNGGSGGEPSAATEALIDSLHAKIRSLEARNSALSKKLAAEVELVVDLQTKNVLLDQKVDRIRAERDSLTDSLSYAQSVIAGLQSSSPRSSRGSAPPSPISSP